MWPLAPHYSEGKRSSSSTEESQTSRENKFLCSTVCPAQMYQMVQEDGEELPAASIATQEELESFFKKSERWSFRGKSGMFIY